MPTKIEWTHIPGTIGESWNPVTGCSKISEGCKFCYAERMARRLAGRHGYPEHPHHFDVTLHPDKLDQPLKWKKPRTVFTVSMGDLFHEEVPDYYIWYVWWEMAKAKQHIFQVLTKRPERMYSLVKRFVETESPGLLPNIWLGVTAENQECANGRIPVLLQTPAAVRFVSCEPLLGKIDLRWYLGTGEMLSQHYLDWVIVGGESGPNARPMKASWVREIIEQCKAAKVAVFVKQLGSHIARSSSLITDSRGGNPNEWLADLRVREYPDDIR